MITVRHLKGKVAAILFAVLSLLLFGLQPAAAAEHTQVKDVRFWKSDGYVRIVFDLTKSVEFTNGKLANPERLFFDLKNTKLSPALKKIVDINSDAVKSVRLGQFSADTARVVFDMAVPTYSFKVMILEDPSRLVVDIYADSGKAKSKDEIKAEAPAQPRPAEPPKTAQPATKMIRRTIVLDPGHGGHDPGAVGPTGLYEKDVVLDISKRVKKILAKSNPSYDIVLTRDTDVFIPLPVRADIAKDRDADLFISVHANASNNRKARGIETYFLNYTDNAEALRVAARENAVSLKKMKQTQGELNIILASLDSETKRDQSMYAAGYIQRSMTSNVTKKYPQIADHGVKFAPFYVLVGAKMPASLVEVSFISNRDEEKMLKTEAYRQLIAQSIADGINRFFATRSAPIVADEEPAAGRPRTTRISYSGKGKTR